MQKNNFLMIKLLIIKLFFIYRRPKLSKGYLSAHTFKTIKKLFFNLGIQNHQKVIFQHSICNVFRFISRQLFLPLSRYRKNCRKVRILLDTQNYQKVIFPLSKLLKILFLRWDIDAPRHFIFLHENSARCRILRT